MFVKVTSEGVVLNKAELALIPEFKVILNKVYKGIPKDHDGRKKLMNQKIFAYIYYMSDTATVNSVIRIPEYNQRHKEAIKKSQLPSEWKPDELVENAIKFYEKEHYNVEIDKLIKLERLLHSTFDSVVTLNENIDTLKKQLQTEKNKEGIPSIIADITNSASSIVTVTTKLFDLTDKIKIQRDKLIKEGAFNSNIKGEKGKRGLFRREVPANQTHLVPGYDGRYAQEGLFGT